MPAELQARVHDEVEATHRRSGWSARRTLAALGVSRASYYRWRRATRETSSASAAVPRSRAQPFEATEAERQAVLAYARKHPALRHRELAWRMVDEDVAYVSPSTVYRILKAANLVEPWRRRTKRRRADNEKASRPDERWSTDVMYVRIGEAKYYLATFLDEYSRYLVHFDLQSSMDGNTLSLGAQQAIETLPRDASGRRLSTPEIRTDNGSGYVSREFRVVLTSNGLTHHRIKPHCPEENGLHERSNRTLRDALEEVELESYQQAREALSGIVKWYNEERLHSALGYLRPGDYYRGCPADLLEARRKKLVAARHRRREENLQVRQRTLCLEPAEANASKGTEKSQIG